MLMVRGLVVFTALCSASIGLAPPPEPLVTIRTGAPTVAQFLADLSQQAGVKLTSAGVVASERIVVNVKDAPLNELLAKIAEVTTAEWQTRDGGYRLERTPSVLRKVRGAQFKRT